MAWGALCPDGSSYIIYCGHFRESFSSCVGAVSPNLHSVDPIHCSFPFHFYAICRGTIRLWADSYWSECPTWQRLTDRRSRSDATVYSRHAPSRFSRFRRTVVVADAIIVLVSLAVRRTPTPPWGRPCNFRILSMRRVNAPTIRTISRLIS